MRDAPPERCIDITSHRSRERQRSRSRRASVNHAPRPTADRSRPGYAGDLLDGRMCRAVPVCGLSITGP
ncbi:hypothetical protein KCP75_17530 [Salmonella enterica subsp. enterica]|nr:hypothetical protein KCP75_17530 [Salmonella enterica subsp. enterica]